MPVDAAAASAGVTAQCTLQHGAPDGMPGESQSSPACPGHSWLPHEPGMAWLSGADEAD
jgi:hypothetical protein